MCKCEGASLQWRLPHITGTGHDAGRLEQYACICLVAGSSSAGSAFKSHVEGAGAFPMWQSDECQILLQIFGPSLIFGMPIH